jgi:hypothetical protein
MPSRRTAADESLLRPARKVLRHESSAAGVVPQMAAGEAPHGLSRYRISVLSYSLALAWSSPKLVQNSSVSAVTQSKAITRLFPRHRET